MNENIKAGADIHAGDGGYSIGTQEKYDEFVKIRNQSLAEARIKKLAEQQAGSILMDLVMPDAGMSERVKWNVGITTENLEKFAELIVRECIGCCEQVISDPVPESVDTWLNGGLQCIDEIKQHFGVKE